MRLQCCMAARSSTVAGRMHTIFNMKSYLLNFRCETVLTQKGAKQKTPQKTQKSNHIFNKKKKKKNTKKKTCSRPGSVAVMKARAAMIISCKMPSPERDNASRTPS